MKRNYLPYVIIGSLILVMGAVMFFSNEKISTPIKTTIDETTPTTTETNVDLITPESTKFVVFVYEVEVPYLAYQPSYYTPMNVLVEEFYYLDWIKGEVPLSVMELKNFDNNLAYKILDEQEEYVTIVPEILKKDVELYIKNYSHKSKLLNNKVKIIKRHYIAFDSYAEASIKRQELLKPQSN